MKKVSVVELVNIHTDEFLGFAPVIEERGEKSKMILVEGKPVSFKTRKEAKNYGLDWIKPKN